MKAKKIYLLLFFLIQIQTFGWGFFAHKRINRLAVFTLPAEMLPFFKQNILFITENAINPDQRRYAVDGEAPKHYIDIDIYGDSAIYKMPKFWKSAAEKYSEDTLIAYGTNPWHVYKMKFELTEAFKQMDAKRILRLAADMGHYIADGNVPLHTTHNYNGQYTNQVGIHGFWETRLVELYSDEYDFFVGKADYIKNPQLKAWEAITNAHLALDSVLKFEKKLTQEFDVDKKYTFDERGGMTVKTYSKAFCKAYHTMLDGQVERRMIASIKMIGDFWYTCWVDAGQPDLSLILDFKFSKEDEEEMKRETEQWQQKQIETRPEGSLKGEHDNHHANQNCCGHHDFFTYKLQVVKQFEK